MSSTTNATPTLLELVAALDIPPSFYDKAVARYKSIGDWLCRPESSIEKYNPRVQPQGSFRLGTVIRPLAPCDEYDLDIVCELLLLTKAMVTQKWLKDALGGELRLYADAKGIKEPLVERKRCWRLEYADDVNFHIDNLPCVPEDSAVIKTLIGLCVPLELAQLAIALTCKTHESYAQLCANWPTSNPAGFAIWFEGRMADIASVRRRQLFKEGAYKTVDEIPTYALKTPLQRVVQLLKRHRDVMFVDDPDVKPISMIITTLSAHAYDGEEDLHDALANVLHRMPAFVSQRRPRIANPVNPGEDFADKWASDPELEMNFWRWHTQAKADFAALASQHDGSKLKKLAETRMGVGLGDSMAKKLAGQAVSITAPTILVSGGPKPWSNRG